jgi:PAS domain S-box-containing protein
MSGFLAQLLAKDPMERRRPTVLGFAVVMYAAVVALRFAVGDPAAPIMLFMLVPIAIVAIELGSRGGMAAAATAVVTVGAWSVVDDVRLSPVVFVSRLTAFFLVGLLVGCLIDRLQAVREAQRRLLESSLDPIVGLSIDGRVQSVNARALALFGRRREEMIGHEIEHFLPGFFSRLREQMLNRRALVFAFEHLGRNNGGRTFPVDVNVSAWESEEGALLLSLRS